MYPVITGKNIQIFTILNQRPDTKLLLAKIINQIYADLFLFSFRSFFHIRLSHNEVIVVYRLSNKSTINPNVTLAYLD